MTHLTRHTLEEKFDENLVQVDNGPDDDGYDTELDKWHPSFPLLPEELQIDVIKSRIFTSLIPSIFDEVIGVVEGMGFVSSSQAGQFSMHTDGYNQAIEEVVEYLKRQREELSTPNK